MASIVSYKHGLCYSGITVTTKYNAAYNPEIKDITMYNIVFLCWNHEPNNEISYYMT